MDDNATNTVVLEDIDNQNLISTVNTTTISVTGIDGNALNLGSSNSASKASLFLPKNSTIDLWFYKTSSTGNFQTIFDYYIDGSTRFVLNDGTSDKYSIYLYGPTTCERDAFGPTIELNTWNHITLRRYANDSGVALYVNGLPVGGFDCTKDWGDISNGTLYINSEVATAYGSAYYDAITVWDRLLNESEILLLNSSFYPYNSFNTNLTVSVIQQMPSFTTYFNYTWFATDILGNSLQSDYFNISVNGTGIVFSNPTVTYTNPIFASFNMFGILISADDGLSNYTFSYYNQSAWINETYMLSNETIVTVNTSKQMPSFPAWFNYTWYATDINGIKNQSDLFSLYVNNEQFYINSLNISPQTVYNIDNVLNCTFNVSSASNSMINVSITWRKNNGTENNITTYDYTFTNVIKNLLYSTDVGTGSVNEQLYVGDQWKCSISIMSAYNTSIYTDSTLITVLDALPGQPTILTPQNDTQVNNMAYNITWSLNFTGHPDTPYNFTILVNGSNGTNAVLLDNIDANTLFNDSGIFYYLWNTSSFVNLVDGQPESLNITIFANNVYGYGPIATNENITVQPYPNITQLYILPVPLYYTDTAQAWIQYDAWENNNHTVYYQWYKNGQSDISGSVSIPNNQLTNLINKVNLTVFDTWIISANVCNNLNQCTGFVNSTSVNVSVHTLRNLTIISPNADLISNLPLNVTFTVWQEDGNITCSLLSNVNSSDSFMLFWDGIEDAPTNWSCVSCNSSQPFYNIMIRGSDVYGGTGGQLTHTHNLQLESIGFLNDTVQTREFGTSQRSSSTHTHSGIENTVVSDESNIPLSRTLKLIRYDYGFPAILPIGVIDIFNDTLPIGWAPYTAQNNYYIFLNKTSNQTFGNNTHIHSFSAELTAASGIASISNVFPTAANINHQHNIIDNTNEVNNTPPYITVTLAQTTAVVYMNESLNLIAVFNHTPSNQWSIISGQSTDFYHRFIMASNTYGLIGGNNSYNHSSLSIMTQGPDTIANARDRINTINLSSDTHQHQVNISFSVNNSIPPYIDIILAKYITVGSNNVLSSVLILNGTGELSYLNYTPLLDGPILYNVSCFAIGNQSISSINYIFDYDTTSPVVNNITDDSSATYPQIGDTLNIAINVTDAHLIDSCIMSLNDTGTWYNYSTYVINTNYSVIYNISYIIQSYSTAAKKSFNYRFYCNDSLNNAGYSYEKNVIVRDVTNSTITLNPNNGFNDQNTPGPIKLSSLLAIA
jgi:hypothetical protein